MLKDQQNHYVKIRNILIFILILNWLVALAKILLGLSTRCASILADGFHSLSDGASNILGLIGIKYAGQPKDKDHPYGHRKYENLFAMGIGVLMLFIFFNLLKEGFLRIVRPIVPEINLTSFLVMLITLLINIAVVYYELKKGKKLQSEILISDALHTQADIFTSISVIIALFGMKSGMYLLDPITTLLIAGFIARGAIDIFRQGSRVLCDSVAILDEKIISDIVLGIKEVKACHKIRTRGRQDEIYLDLHVQVDPKMQVQQAHKISYTIEETIKRQIPNIADIVVHIEPQE